MPQKLIDLVARLDELPQEHAIYAKKPWSRDSQASVMEEPPDGGIPVEAKVAGMDYFIEVFIASEFIGGWVDSLGSAAPSDEDKCERLIHYAIYDA